MEHQLYPYWVSRQKLGKINVQKQSPEVLYKKSVFKNFANFTGKHLCWSLFLIELQALSAVTSLKRDSHTAVFKLNLRNF